MNFKDFVKRTRMETATRMLEQTNLRVYEIAAKVGYRNTKHFRELFRSFHGCSPAEYRKKSEKPSIS